MKNRQTRCVIDLTSPDYIIPTVYLYNEYENFCQEKRARPLEMNVFGSKLKEYGIEKDRIRSHGNREYYYFGIKLRSDLRGLSQSLLNNQNKVTLLFLTSHFTILFDISGEQVQTNVIACPWCPWLRATISFLYVLSLYYIIQINLIITGIDSDWSLGTLGTLSIFR